MGALAACRGEPLPKRLKTVNQQRKGQPITDVTFTEWNLAPQTGDAAYKPNVPSDYEGIAILQRAAAVKATLATPSTEPAAPDKK